MYLLLPRLVYWLLVEMPRGIYHLLNVDAYDRWKIKKEFKAAWLAHRRRCDQCSQSVNQHGATGHQAVVLGQVEAQLIASGEVRHKLPRQGDEITILPPGASRAVLPRGKPAPDPVTYDLPLADYSRDTLFSRAWRWFALATALAAFVGLVLLRVSAG